MRVMLTIARREFIAYFATPLAYVFLVVFLAGALAAPFYFGNFVDQPNFLSSGMASLSTFFVYHPWLFLVFMPAIGMRLWSDERRQGTIELLMTLPVTPWQAVLGKFFAAWAFATLALALTFPIWLTVEYLGDPEVSVIISGYFGSFLMAGALLALASCVSAATNSQVVAFVISVVVGFLLMFAGLDFVIDAFSSWAPDYLISLIASFSFLTHFGVMTNGLIEVTALIYFATLITLLLLINRQIIDLTRAS